MNGRKVVVPPGTSLRVGRTVPADLEIPHDDHLSKVHFALDWDGTRCRVRDLGSKEGTLLDGEAVKEGEVAHGGWVRAGRTNFSVYIEDKIPPLDDDDPDNDELYDEEERRVRVERRAEEEQRRAAARTALTTLRGEARKDPLYAILDTARDDRILELLRQSVEPHQSLYEGIQGEPLSTVAPYLVGPFREDSRFLDRLVMEGWGKRWGIYLTSREPFKEVRRHFRRFLMVELEDTDERVYFRFYDPWVMQVFMPSCSERQKQDFMHGVMAVLAEDAALAPSCLGRAQG
ncbi:DUF4123 domain-containing protein [Polyangium aurulentum]|uniref:DUF4123 domain-containing protein n=1 Tax=Polyangium aurulentum TaxID=2567896 RepID=UPI00146DCD27|nr:DUF4123 domain-containing protein [Polyangium aurulentum]UQA61370.1 DUF4123 domain-containing protein [Polyangium aurulentum]